MFEGVGSEASYSITVSSRISYSIPAASETRDYIAAAYEASYSKYWHLDVNGQSSDYLIAAVSKSYYT